MKRVRFVAQARHEFLAEVSYYRQIQNQLSRRFVASIEEATRRSSGTPQKRGAPQLYVDAVEKLKMPKSPCHKSISYEAIFLENWLFLQPR